MEGKQIEAIKHYPYTVTLRASDDMIQKPVEYHLIPGNWAFGDVLAASRMPKSTADSLKTSGDTENEDAHRLEEYKARLMRRARQLGGPVDLPSRKPASEVLSEHVQVLSRKRFAVLALVEVQVAFEESEAVLLEAYGTAHLEHIHEIYYTTGDPKSAAGIYFDTVSRVHLNPPEL